VKSPRGRKVFKCFRHGAHAAVCFRCAPNSLSLWAQRHPYHTAPWVEVHDGIHCLGVVGPAAMMDVYSLVDDRYIDVWGHLEAHRAHVTAAVRIMQAHVRGWLVRRSVLPESTLLQWIAHAVSGSGLLDPPRAGSVTTADLYLCPIEVGLSWVYCDRSTYFSVADALSPIPRPMPERPHSAPAE
jgi:hypothetical protein